MLFNAFNCGYIYGVSLAGSKLSTEDVKEDPLSTIIDATCTGVVYAVAADITSKVFFPKNFRNMEYVIGGILLGTACCKIYKMFANIKIANPKISKNEETKETTETTETRENEDNEVNQ
jgi:hypothetical protein